MQVMKKACEEIDLNSINEYFSYNHFYVIYCIFWNLNNNEEYIDKEAFSK
jgi:hypothetical protein